MRTVDLRLGGTVCAALREIRGSPNSVESRCVLAREADTLRISVEAEDRDMLNLISSAPLDEPDRFLYEEDCVQITVAEPPGKMATLLVNPHGSRKGTAETDRWTVAVRRHDRGWAISVDVPLGSEARCVGVSVHRFYRGVNGEVQGLCDIVPHPLDAGQFAAVILRGDEASDSAAEAYRSMCAREAAEQVAGELAAARERIARARASGGPTVSLDAAIRLARRRRQVPVVPDEGFLCWDEAHYQRALLDLWELTGEREWLDIAAARMETVLSLRADRRGLTESY